MEFKISCFLFLLSLGVAFLFHFLSVLLGPIKVKSFGIIVSRVLPEVFILLFFVLRFGFFLGSYLGPFVVY